MKRPRIDPQCYPFQLRQAIAECLPARGLRLIGPRQWSDRYLVITILLMVWSPLATLKDRFFEGRAALIGMYPTRRRPGAAFTGFMSTLARHSQRLLALVSTQLRRNLPQRLKEQWKIGDWVVFTVDGSKIDCPRTLANQNHFHSGGKKKSGPQMLLVCLVHLGTGLLWSWRRDEARASERGLLLELLGDLPAGALLVADAGFVGYALLQAVFQQGHSILMRVGANVHLLKNLGYKVREHAGVVYLWPEKKRRQGHAPLVLRMIRVVDGRSRQMCLLTNVLSKARLSDAQVVKLYQRRWGVELWYRSFKQTLQRRKMLSDSPANAQRELDWSVMGQWLLSLMLWQEHQDQLPAHEGLAQALRLVRQAMRPGGRGRSLAAQLRDIQPDGYRRRSQKKARDWPHKKNDPPCGLPEVRTATAQEKRDAKALLVKKRAA